MKVYFQTFLKNPQIINKKHQKDYFKSNNLSFDTISFKNNLSNEEILKKYLKNEEKEDFFEYLKSILKKERFEKLHQFATINTPFMRFLNICHLSDKHFKEFEEHFKYFKDTLIALKAISLSKKELNNLKSLLKEGMNFEEAYACTITYNDSKMARKINSLVRGIPDYIQDDFSFYDNDEYSQIIYFIEQGYHYDEAEEAIFNEVLKNRYLEEIKANNNPTRSFFNSAEYDSKIYKAAEGKYQNELFSLLSKERITYKTKRELIQFKLSEENILSGIKKIQKSTFKLAMDSPNQYLNGIDIKYATKINGHYPKLDEAEFKKEQEKIILFFKNNIHYILRAVKYLDCDTLNQMFDKRISKFEQDLIKLNKLTDENFEILSQLIKCKNKQNNKELSAKEKIELCQIVEMFQEVKLNKSLLIKAIQEKKVNLQEIKDVTIFNIFKELKLNETKTKEIKEENKKFNPEYAYLLLSQNPQTADEKYEFEDFQYYVEKAKNFSEYREKLLKELENRYENLSERNINNEELKKLFKKLIDSLQNIDFYSTIEIMDNFAKLHHEFNSKPPLLQEKIFKDILSATLFGNFKNYILNEDNSYGVANKKTKEIFEENNLNWNKWFNCNFSEKEIRIEDKNLRLKLWNRNPKEDLFIGNKTSCCTAIATGANGKATPIYLLNSAFNVIELKNENNKTTGMARIFFAKNKKTQKPILIIDTFEFNSAFIKKFPPKKQEILKIEFCKYIQEFLKEISDNEIKIYIFNNENQPENNLKKLKKEEIIFDIIGQISEKYTYINCCKCSWKNTEETQKALLYEYN